MSGQVHRQVTSEHSFKLIVSVLQTFIFFCHIYVCGMHVCVHGSDQCVYVWGPEVDVRVFPSPVSPMYWAQSMIIIVCLASWLEGSIPISTSNVAKIRGKPPQLSSVYLSSGNLNLTRILMTGSGFVLCC